MPSSEFNDVDVSAARYPKTRLYLYTTVEGLSAHVNVWAHDADARTYFPQVEMPAQDCRGS